MFPDPLNCLLCGRFLRKITFELLIVYDCMHQMRLYHLDTVTDYMFY